MGETQKKAGVKKITTKQETQLRDRLNQDCGSKVENKLFIYKREFRQGNPKCKSKEKK